MTVPSWLLVIKGTTSGAFVIVTWSLSSFVFRLCAWQIQSSHRGLLPSAWHWHPSSGGPDRDWGAGQYYITVFITFDLFFWFITSACCSLPASPHFSNICHLFCEQGAGMTWFSRISVMLDIIRTWLMKEINPLSPFVSLETTHSFLQMQFLHTFFHSPRAGNHPIRGTETTNQCGQSTVPADQRGFSGESDVKQIRRFHQENLFFFFLRHETRDSDVILFLKLSCMIKITARLLISELWNVRPWWGFKSASQ